MVGVIVIMDVFTTGSIMTGVVAVVTATRNSIASWFTGFTTYGAVGIIRTGSS
jgi:hypothetical protein